MPSSDPPRVLAKSAARQRPQVEPFEGFRTHRIGSSATPVDAPLFPQFSPPGDIESPLAVWGITEAEAPPPDRAVLEVVDDPSLPRPVREARREADRLRAEARCLRGEALAARDRTLVEAARRIDEARARADEIEATAYQAGFQQGEEAGKRLGEQKVEAVLRRLQALVDETARQQDQAIHESEQELVKLAILIALQVIHRELQQDPSVILDTVRAGIERLRRASRLTLRVSPQDYPFLEEHMDTLRAMAPSTTPLSVEPDPTIAHGGCRIVCNTGEVDATIETAVHKLIERVWGEHHPAVTADAPTAARPMDEV